MREKRRGKIENLQVILKLQAILQPQREFKAVRELREEIEAKTVDNCLRYRALTERERERQQIINWQGLCESSQAH